MYPLISTKIRTPQRRQVLLRRDRLVDFIHSNIQHKLILVSAGAGYGKTSLLIDYAHDTDLPVCWYGLDANDAHVPTFVEYLVASIRQRFPQFGERILEAVRAQSAPAESVDPFVRLILNEIDEVIHEYFVIILDDYHELVESEPVNALLDELLRYLPDHAHIVLASRRIPRRLNLTRLAASQEVAGLGVEHLRFTADEISELLCKLGRTDLSPEQTRLLAERSEGWITGILLAAQANWTQSTQDILQISGTMGGVFDYMAAEILERQPPAMQRFLLGSALFHEMTPPLCDALLEISNSAQLLRELTEQNLFTLPLDGEGVWYQYHQLFREFLVSKFATDDPEGCRRLRLKQATIMAHRGHWNRAIDSYIAAEAYDQAADALAIIVQDTFDAGDWGALKGWIDALPEAALAQRPRLLLFRAKIHAETGNPNQASSLLERCYRAYIEREDSVGAARALVQSATIQRFRGRLREAIQICREALHMVGDRDALTLTQAHHNLGICHLMLGQLDEGIAELQEALSHAERNGDDGNAAFIAHDMGGAETMRGHLISARQYYHRALMYWRKVGNASALASTLQSLGVVHHHLAQYAEAENRLQEGLAKAAEAADARIEAYALASQGDLLRDTGRYDAAQAAYRRALDIASSTQLTRLIIYLLDALGNTHRLLGELGRARQVLTEALDQVQETEMKYEAGLCQLSLGIVAARCGQDEEARERYGRACALLGESGTTRDLARAQLHVAALALRHNDDLTVKRSLAEVARLADELGTHQFVVAEGPAIGALLRYAESQGLGGLDYARICAEVAQLGPSIVPTASGPSRPEVVFEFLGLDGGQVRKNRNPVTDWESVSARIMAFLFVTYPQGLRRDRIIDLLWPGVTQAKGNSLFHSTVYRLRCALGKDLVVHESGLYRLDPGCSYVYDVNEFGRLAKEGRGHDDLAHEARIKAIELYRGPFLEFCDHDWCTEVRESLHNEALALVLAEAQHLAQGDRLNEAESLYLRALGLDSFDERAHRGIMWCRAGVNDRAGGLRQYRDCVRILKEELDVEPSAETVHLYEAILAGRINPVPS